MKLIGILSSLVGFVGLLAGAGLENSATTSLLRLVDHWLLSYLLDHRIMIVVVSGFILVAGSVLFGFAGTQRAIALLTEMIREAINTPDVCPAAPPLLNVPAPGVDERLGDGDGIFRQGGMAFDETLGSAAQGQPHDHPQDVGQAVAVPLGLGAGSR